ncbi:pyroglutamyl-peptidase 1 [Gastrophryne carolinensis]
METRRKCVVVTGFGPFGEHKVNASWVAVQELEKLGLGDRVDLQVYEIPVEYQAVQRLIPDLWTKHNPEFIVHVGVSGPADMVTLEKCGHNSGYQSLDVSQFCPDSHCCVDGGPECLHSVFDLDTVCKRATAAETEVDFTLSTDAGRYLCDFTYYTSLQKSQGKSVFIHVPPLGKPYTATQLGHALQTILIIILDMLDNSIFIYPDSEGKGSNKAASSPPDVCPMCISSISCNVGYCCGLRPQQGMCKTYMTNLVVNLQLSIDVSVTFEE